MPRKKKPDVRLLGGGSVFLLQPQTRRANDWIRDNLPDDVMWFGNGVAVEHRYVEDIVNGMLTDGLTVE